MNQIQSQRRTRERNGKDNNNSYESKKISWSFEVNKKQKMLCFD